MMEFREDYHRPPPDVYDAIKRFRQELEQLDRDLKIATDGRVQIKSLVLEHNWELWTRATETDDG